MSVTGFCMINACFGYTDAELLRSLRREIGAPSRPALSFEDDHAGGGAGGGTSWGRPRRSVGGAGGGSINDRSSSIGRLRGKKHSHFRRIYLRRMTEKGIPSIMNSIFVRV